MYVKGRLTCITLIKTKHGPVFVFVFIYIQVLFVLNIFYCVNQKN